MMDRGVYVMMPVKCLGKLCKSCPYLKIDTQVSELFANGECAGYETNLQCRSIGRCLKIHRMVEEQYDD